MSNKPEDTKYLLSLNVIELRTRNVEFTELMKQVYMACVKWREQSLKHATAKQIGELSTTLLDETHKTLITLHNLRMIDYDRDRQKVRWTRSPTTYLEWLNKIRSY